MAFKLHQVFSDGTAYIIDKEKKEFLIREQDSHSGKFSCKKAQRTDLHPMKYQFSTPSFLFAQGKEFEKEDDFLKYLDGLYCFDAFMCSVQNLNAYINADDSLDTTFTKEETESLLDSYFSDKKIPKELQKRDEAFNKKRCIELVDFYQKKFKDEYMNLFKDNPALKDLEACLEMEPAKIYGFFKKKGIVKENKGLERTGFI